MASDKEKEPRNWKRSVLLYVHDLMCMLLAVMLLFLVVFSSLFANEIKAATFPQLYLSCQQRRYDRCLFDPTHSDLLYIASLDLSL